LHDIGSEERYEALAARYGALIRAVVRKVGALAGPAVGEEIEQRIRTELWKRCRNPEPIEYPDTYVYRAAVRETVRAMRRESARAGEPLRAEPAAVQGDDPHHRLAVKELGGMLREAIGRLAPDRARAVRLHLAGFTVHEMMALHGWPYQRARNLVARGLAEVRRGLKQRGIDAGRRDPA
jgi:DNA-directed RNA polymerase specialized sigma24 family protein